MIRRRFLAWMIRWMERQNNFVELPDGTQLRRMSWGFADWVRGEGWRTYIAQGGK